ncbi:MAG: alginate export family protein [Labilithrix sp.]|nr:alginate export family protein [Labilithrix sp.]
MRRADLPRSNLAEPRIPGRSEGRVAAVSAARPRRDRSFVSLARVGAALASLSAASPAAAQSPPEAPEKLSVGDWQLSPSLQVRVRGEYRRDAPDLGGTDFFGRQSPRVRDQWVVLERSRVGLGAERGAVRAQITLQDARALGSPAPTARLADERGIGRFEPYEAYAEMRSSGARPNYLRLGRQAVQWGEGRLVGTADFSPSGRSLDAARGHLALGSFDFEALAVILEVPGPLGAAFTDTAGPETSGVQLYGLSASYQVAPLLRVEAFGLARVSRSNGAELDGSRFAASRLAGERFTAALRVSGDGKGWTYGAEGAYQFGAASSLAIGGTDISAWAAAAHVSKTLEELVFTPNFRVAGSYASGDDRKGVYKQFDPLLADPQRFHGQMDLFGWSNMMDVAGRAQIQPATHTSVALEYRWARLAQARGEWIGSYLGAVGSASVPPLVATTPAPPGPSGSETDLGHELDVVVSYRPWTPLELRAGWSGLLLGDGAKATMAAHARGSRLANGAISPANIAQYAYLQATLTMP